MSDIAVPKNQVLLDRLRRRLDGYRHRHDDSIPRFEQTITGINEEEKRQTMVLQQRFVESKAKKSQKKGDKKDSSSNNSNKSHKRQVDDSSDHGDNYEPPKKLSNSSPSTSTGFSTSPNKGRSKMKFHPPERKNGLQQHLPPSASATATSSTTNNSMSPLSCTPTTPTQQMPPPLLLDFKQEVCASSIGYVDLDQCAAALEKDGPDGIINSDTLNDLISDLSSADFMKDFDFGDDDLDKSDSATNSLVIVGNLSSNSCNSTNQDNSHPPSYPVTPITPTNTNSPMHSNHNNPHVKIEGDLGGHMGGLLQGHQCAGPSPAPATTASPLASQLTNQGSTPPYLFDPTGSPVTNTSTTNSSTSGNNKSRFNSPAATLPIDSPAAQTLKQMAEQHQHKAQMGMGNQAIPQGQGQSVTQNFKNASPARSPFNEYPTHGQFPPQQPSSSANEFMGASSNVNSSNANTNPQQQQQFPSGGSRPPPLGQPGEMMGVVGGPANVKQEVYSPTTQTSFSPGFMDVKRGGGGGGGQGGGGGHMQNHRMQHPQQVLSPVSKSFNHSGGMDPSLMSGQSFIPRPANGSSNPSSYPSFPGSSPQQQMNNSNAQQQMAGRGSPSGLMDNKVRIGGGHPGAQPGPGPGVPPSQQGNYYYPNNGMNTMDTSPPYNHMGAMTQQNGPQGQTINFTQQHLRIGGPSSGNMPPRMNVPPNMSRMSGPGAAPIAQQQQRGPPPPNSQQQQQPPPNQQQQQQLMMRQQQQQQHMAQQQQQQQMGQPGMMPRYPGPNGPRGPVPMQQGMQPVQQQMVNVNPPQRPPPHMQAQHQQHQQMYNNSNGHMGQMGGGGGGMGGPPGSMGNIHMRQNMSPYNNGNHNMMGNNGPPPQQQQQNMQMGGRGEWMSMDGRGQQQFPPQNSMGRQQQPGPPQRPNMQQMSYHSGMPMQMSQNPGGGGAMMPTSYSQQGSMMPQMGYNPNPQMQHTGFNQQPNHVKPPSQGYGAPPSQNFMPMKPPNGSGPGGAGLMCQQQSSLQFQNHPGMKQQQLGMTNDINIDQMLNNITDDPNFSGGDTADLFNSLENNFILDDL